MGQQGQTAQQLCLKIRAGTGGADRLGAVLAAIPVASVVIRPAHGGGLDVASARQLVALCQQRGAAALIEADAQLARTLKADGVHLPACPDPVTAYEEARSILGQRAIVGVEASGSRHDAMLLGEAGADYISFAPDARSAADAETGAGDPLGAMDQLALVAWWSELFEVPVIADGIGTEAAADAALAAGADFLCFELAAAQPTAACVESARRIARRIGGGES